MCVVGSDRVLGPDVVTITGSHTVRPSEILPMSDKLVFLIRRLGRSNARPDQVTYFKVLHVTNREHDSYFNHNSTFCLHVSVIRYNESIKECRMQIVFVIRSTFHFGARAHRCVAYLHWVDCLLAVMSLFIFIICYRESKFLWFLGYDSGRNSIK